MMTSWADLLEVCHGGRIFLCEWSAIMVLCHPPLPTTGWGCLDKQRQHAYLGVENSKRHVLEGF